MVVLKISLRPSLRLARAIRYRRTICASATAGVSKGGEGRKEGAIGLEVGVGNGQMTGSDWTNDKSTFSIAWNSRGGIDHKFSARCDTTFTRARSTV